MDPLHAAAVGICLFAMVLWAVGRFVIGREAKKNVSTSSSASVSQTANDTDDFSISLRDRLMRRARDVVENSLEFSHEIDLISSSKFAGTNGYTKRLSEMLAEMIELEQSAEIRRVYIKMKYEIDRDIHEYQAIVEEVLAD